MRPRTPIGLIVAPNDTLACLIVSSANSITGNTFAQTVSRN